MIKFPALIVLIFTSSLWAQKATSFEENELMKSCSKLDLEGCKKLGAYYLSKSNWENAFLVGEALCGKEVFEGCTFAGVSLLAMNKPAPGKKFLNLACDEFEPLACRSMARLLQKNKEDALANMYFKRACFYGLKEVCKDVYISKPWYTPASKTILDVLNTDCEDPKGKACEAHLQTIKSCKAPLASLDCQLLAGHLSIFFRAKFLQSEAKLALFNLYELEKKLKEDPKFESYSYDLTKVMKDQKPLKNYHYVIGFMKPCVRKFVNRKKADINTLELNPQEYEHFGMRIKSNIQNYFAKGKAGDCYDPKPGYEAFAIGSLDPHDPSRLDVWKIDQDKNIQVVKDGLPLP